MNERGHYGRSRGFARGRAFVGALTPESLKEDLAQMHDDIFALSQELGDQRAMLATAGRLVKSPFEVFFKNRWLPFYNEWRRFYDAVKDAALTPITLPAINAQLHGYWSRWIDVKTDARGAIINASPSGAPPAAPPPPGPPSSTPSPPGPSSPTQPPSVPLGPPESGTTSAAEKGPNYGLYAVLGLGVIAVIGIGFAVREAA